MNIDYKKPKVSICVVTYNHEKYIQQCLQSIIDQKTNFEFEIIIGDDCSTDKTREITEQFAEKYPNTVKLLTHSKNIGAVKNYIAVHEFASGEYIAHVDGDDYILPHKLQIQCDFLDENPDINIAWHRMYVKSEVSGLMQEDRIELENLPRRKFERKDILRFITIGMNSSKMYRASVRDIVYPSFPMLDYFANVEQVKNGYAGFAGDVPLGVYRAGMGMASVGNMTKDLLGKTFLYFLERYPQYRSDIGGAAFLLFLAALKNRKWKDCSLFLPTLRKTFGWKVIFEIFHNRKIIAMLRLPKLSKGGR